MNDTAIDVHPPGCYRRYAAGLTFDYLMSRFKIDMKIVPYSITDMGNGWHRIQRNNFSAVEEKRQKSEKRPVFRETCLFLRQETGEKAGF